MKVLLTGAAGFIGFHTAQALLARGDQVIGVDDYNPYYDPALKEARSALLKQNTSYHEERMTVADTAAVADLFARHRPDRVVHLAAQAGVRYSVDHPHVYAQANLAGFLNVLEACRQGQVEHLVYASTSSVYGGNGKMPFQETDGVGHPMSLYAATKRANEVMAHSYSHLFRVPTTGLRFFTVYGPWGRPDMALFKFTRAILAGQAIDVYNHGDMRRDFTYVSDIVAGILAVLDRPAAPDPQWNGAAAQPDPDRSAIAPFRIYNIGRGAPVPLMDFIRVLEQELGVPARLNLLPMQQGDVAATFADTSALKADTGYAPQVSVQEGVAAFVRWYRDFYGA